MPSIGLMCRLISSPRASPSTVDGSTRPGGVLPRYGARVLVKRSCWGMGLQAPCRRFLSMCPVVLRYRSDGAFFPSVCYSNRSIYEDWLRPC